MRIRIDPARDTFLADHVAGGLPVLPTVMQLDLVARGLLAAGARGAGAVAPAGVLLRDVVVGPPVRFTGPDARDLNFACTPYRPAGTRDAAIRCELRTPGETVPHLTAVAAFTAGPAPRPPAPPGGEPWLPCGPDLVYPPFFHGPSFRVIASFGRAGAGFAARLAGDLPPLGWASGGTILRPRLLELLLQCCGLQELADSGRMRVPAGIEAVHWHPGSLAADPAVPALARVVPRSGPHGHGRVFDGQVAADDGSVLVTVTGYRTCGLDLTPQSSEGTPR